MREDFVVPFREKLQSRIREVGRLASTAEGVHLLGLMEEIDAFLDELQTRLISIDLQQKTVTSTVNVRDLRVSCPSPLPSCSWINLE